MNEELHRFCDWLAKNGHDPFPWQRKVAAEILEMPFMSGRSWIIRRLFEFDIVSQGHIMMVLDFISVEERLPEEADAYYAIDEDGLCCDGNPIYFHKESGVWMDYVGEDLTPTHWAEIPEIE